MDNTMEFTSPNRPIVRNLLIGAGVLATGIAVSKMVSRKRSTVHQYRKQVDAWLKERLDTLEHTLGIAEKEYRTLKREIERTVQLATVLAKKAHHASPQTRDLLAIALDKRLFKMRKRIHKIIDTTEETQIASLQKFYEELRTWLTNIPYMHEELAREEEAGSQLRTA